MIVMIIIMMMVIKPYHQTPCRRPHPPPSPQQSSSYLEVPLHLLNPQQRSFLLQGLKFSDPPSTISAAQK